MPQKKTLSAPLFSPAGVGTGTAVSTADMTSAIVQVASIGTGTYKVMQSFDGAHFLQAGSSLTADGSQAISDAAVAVRVDCSAYTSGTPTAVVSGIKQDPY